MTETTFEQKTTHKVTLTSDQVRDIILHYVGARGEYEYTEIRDGLGDAIHTDFQVLWVTNEQIDVELAE